MKAKIKAKLINTWLFNSSELVDWPTGKPRAWKTVEPDQPATNINDVYQNTNTNNTKCLTFVRFEKP